VSTRIVNHPGSWVDMLHARPIRNSAARAVENQQNGVTVYVKQRRPGWFVPPLSWIVHYRRERRVTLDSLGKQIWELCDGHVCAEDLIDRFAEAEGLTFHEARAAVTGYVKMLIKRGVLAIVMQEDS